MHIRSLLGILTTLGLVGALSALLAIPPTPARSPAATAQTRPEVTATEAPVSEDTVPAPPVVDAPASAPIGLGPLHTDGGDIVDADGRVVHISGVNWFGLETGTFAPQGLLAGDDTLGPSARSLLSTWLSWSQPGA
jgi:hypothetical protein